MNIQSAKNASEFVRCVSRDKNGKIQVGLVPGHDAKIYKVALVRYRSNVIIGSCHTETESCKGNQHGICYHAMALLIYAAKQNGIELNFYEITSELQGNILVSRKSNKQIGMSYRRKNEHCNRQEQPH